MKAASSPQKPGAAAAADASHTTAGMAAAAASPSSAPALSPARSAAELRPAPAPLRAESPCKRSDGSDCGLRSMPSPKSLDQGLVSPSSGSHGHVAWAGGGTGSSESPTASAARNYGSAAVSPAGSGAPVAVRAPPRPGTGACEQRPPSGGATCSRQGSDLDLRAVGSRNAAPLLGCSLGDWEPIIERVGPHPAGAPALQHAGVPSPLRKSLSRSGGLGEFEPIIERCEPPPGGPPCRNSRTPPPPPVGSAAPPASAAPRASQAYFRQLGVRMNWQTGDVAYWRGQACRVVRCLPEDNPLCVVLRIPDGSEVTTDLCLLSEAPSNVRAPALHADSAFDTSRPLRLAPLGDLLIDRPSALDGPSSALAALLQLQQRPPTMPSPRALLHPQQPGGPLGPRSHSGSRGSSGRTSSPLGPLPSEKVRPPSGSGAAPSRRAASPSRFVPLAMGLSM